MSEDASKIAEPQEIAQETATQDMAEAAQAQAAGEEREAVVSAEREAEAPQASDAAQETETAEKPRSMWDKAIDGLERLSKQHHVLALRDGMILSVPIILVGSMFLLLGSQAQILEQYFNGSTWLLDIVHTSFGQWFLSNVQLIYMPYRVTMGMLSIYVAFTIAAALAKQYELPQIPQGLGAAAALLATGTPVRVSLAEGEGAQWVVAMKPLGPEGLFLAIILGVAMVEISRLFISNKPANPDHAAIPPSVLDAFRSFLPMLTLVGIVWIIRHALNFDIQAGILWLMQPLNSLGDSLAAVLASNFFLHLFAVAGVHGISVINAVMLPLWQQFVAANAEAHSQGLPLPHVTAYPFYQWFIWMGGTGAALGPVAMLFFFKSERMRHIGKISIVPALFNVNEPFLFGMPVVANPLLAVPCILAPLACGLTAWFAVSWGLVTAPFIEVPWVLPCYLGALLSTQDWRSLVLVTLNLAISCVIWYPFLRVYEKRG